MNQAEIKRQQTEEMAGILTLITVFILGNRMQEGGITYMTAAVSICMLAGIAVCGQLSDGLGRILRSRRNKGQYKSVLMIRKVILFQNPQEKLQPHEGEKQRAPCQSECING